MGNSSAWRWLQRFAFGALCVAGVVLAGSESVIAQVGPGGLINPNKDCQTVRRCNFSKGGSFRGCVSSYTCRTCRFVKSKCSIGGKAGTCRQLRCSWGG